MRYFAVADTDIGISKNTNQDSVLIKQALTDRGEVLLAVICDGMGGLSKGELASATVVKAFFEWFDNELPLELEFEKIDIHSIGAKWSLLLKELNAHIRDYGRSNRLDGIGTTFTGILFADDQYIIGHVGDTRAYHIGSNMTQLTTDQTFVAREVSRGTMTLEQASIDKRRNALLQCVGASDVVEPQIIIGNVKQGAYMLCSDGFRHVISEEEMYESFNPIHLINKEVMRNHTRYLIEKVKNRKEKDNISVVVIKVG